MKTHIMWTDKELKILKNYGIKLSSYELCELLPRHTACGIRAKRKRMGIVVSEETKKNQARRWRSLLNPDFLCKGDLSLTMQDLDSITKQILLGSILGDGCLKKNGGAKNQRNYIFYEGHSLKQAEYCKWKYEKLKIFKTTYNQYLEKNRIELRTTSFPLFTELRKKFYGSDSIGNKLPMDILSELDLFGLLIWYLDDGYYGCPEFDKHQKPYPSITIKRCDYNDLCVLVNSINRKYGLNLFVAKHKHNGGWNKKIMIKKEDRKKLFPLWADMFKEQNIPDCMSYKLRSHLML